MEVVEFVSQHLGADLALKLKRIGVGGGNNKKGSDFENFYATAKICMVAAEWPSHDTIYDFKVSSQEVAFVDDLCVRRISSSSKVNYQAKNSPNAAADWDIEMQDRFGWQQKVDLEFHQIIDAKQILVVSSAEKAAANDDKIPDHMKEYCASEHFPYHTSSTRLVLGYAPLRDALSKLCASDNIQVLDTAFKVVLGEWISDNAEGRVVGDVISHAKASSRPDTFAGVTPDEIVMRAPDRDWDGNLQEEPPEWLRDLLAAFQMAPACIESGAFIVSHNGMQVRVAFDAWADPEKLQALRGPGDIFMYLMSLAADELVGEATTGN